MPVEPFGQVLRKAREERGISQRALAVKAGVTDSYVSQLESGRRRPPRPRVIAALAVALGLTAETLLEAADLERAPTRLRRRLRSVDRERGKARRTRDRLLGSTLFHLARGPRAIDPFGACTDLPLEQRILLGRVFSRAREIEPTDAAQRDPEDILSDTTAAEREIIARVLPDALAASPGSAEVSAAPARSLPIHSGPTPTSPEVGRLLLDASRVQEGHFLWRMEGDQAHPRIEDGDLVLLDAHGKPRDGDWVVLLHDGRIEVRSWHVRGAEARLDAVRPDSPPLRVPTSSLRPCVVRGSLRLPPAP